MGAKLALLVRKFFNFDIKPASTTQIKHPPFNKDWRPAISQETPRYIYLFITYDNDQLFLNSIIGERA